ncbi:hypothetical protein [Thomasclavelia saccharogumia]|uniref:hypothetical protein n=1 Tax=Thomasclavelia saccharogumia TaxID=341225 RepID=UPI000AC58160|nr:hypothetical protein [Thomasclavelia saccharogumia]
MNKRMIIFTLGKLLQITGLLMYIPVIVAIIYQETEGISFAVLGALIFCLGTIISYKRPTKKISMPVKDLS